MAAVVNTRQRRLSSAVSNNVTLGKYSILMVTNVSKNLTLCHYYSVGSRIRVVITVLIVDHDNEENT